MVQKSSIANSSLSLLHFEELCQSIIVVSQFSLIDGVHLLKKGSLYWCFKQSVPCPLILSCNVPSFKSDYQEGKTQHPYVRACNEIIPHIFQRMVNPLYRINWIY